MRLLLGSSCFRDLKFDKYYEKNGSRKDIGYNDYFYSQYRYNQWIKASESNTIRLDHSVDDDSHSKEKGTVGAVTHAGFIVASVIALFGIPRPGTGARLDPDHVSLTEWHCLEVGWRLVRYNVR